MNLKKLFVILPLAIAPFSAQAETPLTTGTIFDFSTEVSRTIDQDLMRVELFSHKQGKSLAELKQQVSANLNKVLEMVKQYPSIQVSANGIRNYADYSEKNRVEKWFAEGSLYLESQDFDSIAKVLESLGNDVAIRDVSFSVSRAKMQALEDEMTLDVIKQFQHKAEVIQKGLNASQYKLSNVRLTTPNGEEGRYRAMPMMAMAKSADMLDQSLPLEAGKQTITATASGQVEFK